MSDRHPSSPTTSSTSTPRWPSTVDPSDRLARRPPTTSAGSSTAAGRAAARRRGAPSARSSPPPSAEVRARQIATAIGAATTSGTGGESGPGPLADELDPDLAGRSRRRRPTGAVRLAGLGGRPWLPSSWPSIAVDAAAHSGPSTRAAARATMPRAARRRALPPDRSRARPRRRPPGVQNGDRRRAPDPGPGSAMPGRRRPGRPGAPAPRARYGSERAPRDHSSARSAQAAPSAGPARRAGVRRRRSGPVDPASAPLVFEPGVTGRDRRSRCSCTRSPGPTTGASPAVAAASAGCTVLVDRPL